ncbi:MAG: hypothetical protein SEPTF4163_002048 [Sporothrix epigloea]
MSYTSTAQRVPAWKRLGLKLKGSTDDSNSGSPAVATVAPTPASVFSPAARKPYQSPSSSQYQSSTPNKRREPPASAAAPSAAKRHKSVSFAETGNAAGATTAPKKAKKAKKAKKKSSEPNPASKEPSNLDRELEYLQQWKTSRDTWKFNKNHQSLLIKYLFVGGANNAGIPATHIDIFYDYIRSLQGGVRTRLRQEAREICKLDDEAAGSADTAAATSVTGSKDKEAKSEAQLKDEDEYKQIVAEIQGVLSNKDGEQPQRLCEADYELRFIDPAIQKRLRRRIRAENVVNELAGDDEEIAVAPTAKPAEKASGSALVHRRTSDAQSIPSVPPVSSTAVKSNERPVKPNNGTVKKPARSRKQRTAVESSDDSDSDSDSDSSSSSSDDDSSGAAIPKAATSKAAQKSLDAPSSSESSSSDSESDSDSDED